MPPPPFSRVDHLVIAVRDLAAAERHYTALLGRHPSARGAHPDLGTHNVIFGLANCYVELLALATAAPVHPVAVALAAFLERTPEGLLAIAFGSDALEQTAVALRSAGIAVGDPSDLEIVAPDGGRRRARLLAIAREQTRGVNVFAIVHDRAAIPLAAPRGSERASASSVDHVVLFTDDLEGGLCLWRDAFAIPERWRREFPDRGTINVGLRLGGVTLELVAPLGAAAGERGERLWGVAYAVQDCDAAVARLRAEAIPVSDARAGLAPATRVVTVKRADGVPTLLIQHTDR
ncbi:MAG: VOC family protein [Deltaproteobacteria bacterium]|nr:VOC family protein [Deltaproteobacteria bacterium]